jgi:hypothetical protein
MNVYESNRPSHRSVARLSPPIRKRQEGYFNKNIPRSSLLTPHF